MTAFRANTGFAGGVRAGSLTLRPALRGDAAALAAMAPDVINGTRVTAAERRRLVAAMVDQGQVVAAVGPDGVVAGALNLARAGADLMEVGWAVAPRFRGQGVGTAIAEAGIARLVEDGWTARCTIEPGNAASLRIAARLGLEPAAEWHPGCVSFARGPSPERVADP